MFFFKRNCSPLLFISRSSSFLVIQVNVDIKILVERKIRGFFSSFFFSLSESPGGHVISRQIERGA